MSSAKSSPHPRSPAASSSLPEQSSWCSAEWAASPYTELGHLRPMHSPIPLPPVRIVLTGFMGSGKSTVGPLIAQRLGWRNIDVDDVIEAEAGRTIAQIFALHGEAAFRHLEHQTNTKHNTNKNLILA